MKEFERNIAVIVAVAAYRNKIQPLRTPVKDAVALARALRDVHKFDIKLLRNGAATRDGLRAMLVDLASRIGPNDRVIFYFAGHGIALPSDGGPRGYILLSDASREKGADSFMPMADLDGLLTGFDCRHMLVVLDCCFAGAFRWSSRRRTVVPPEALHRELYDWYIKGRAWQAIASAAHNQEAIDVAANQPLGRREDEKIHSPFARALIEGLRGAADRLGADGASDGVITATELYLFVDEALRAVARGRPQRQIPVFWPLEKHEHGQFVFLAPGHSPDTLKPAPPLTDATNPWLGLESYGQHQGALFYGRTPAIAALRDCLLGKPATEAEPATTGHRLIIVSGPSGAGKSSLVKAGLLPALPPGMRTIVVRPFVATDPDEPANPARDSRAPTAGPTFSEPLALEDYFKADQRQHCVLVIDQAEEALRVTAARLEPVAMPSLWPGKLTALLRKHAPKLTHAIGENVGSHAISWLNARRRQWSATAGPAAIPNPPLLPIDAAAAGRDTSKRFLAALERILSTAPHVCVVITVRSEYEGQLAELISDARWSATKYSIAAMTREQFRQVIEGPAGRAVVRFDPPDLVDRLVDDVAEMPGALPMLSFAMSDMYSNFMRRRSADDRSLTAEDYAALGNGVASALRSRAQQLIDQCANATERNTMRRVLDRLVSVENGEFARRRISRDEFETHDPEENARVQHTLDKLITSRLVVSDGREVEFAHDALLRSWDQLRSWTSEDAVRIAEQRRLAADGAVWSRDPGRNRGRLWADATRLPLAMALNSAPFPGLNTTEQTFAIASMRQAGIDRAVRWAIICAFALLTVGASWFFLDRNNRAVTAQLLDRAGQINAMLDGPNQLNGLMAAVEAADLSKSRFGRLINGVRSGLLHALDRAREVDRWADPGPLPHGIAATSDGMSIGASR